MLDSLYHQAYNSRANLYADNGLDYKALLDYTKAIELNLFSNKYLLNRAILLIDMKKFDQACFDLSKSDSLGNKEAKVYRKKYCN